MSNSTSPTATPQEAALQALLSAIVSRDTTTASRMLADSPLLARTAVATGASRAGGGDFFFTAIAHYAYAGDTPLHFAAAAGQRDIAEDLVARGANVRARNRRGAEPLHYACDGAPGSAAWDPDAQAAIVEFLIGLAPIQMRRTRAAWRRCTAPCGLVPPAPCGRCSPTGLTRCARTSAARRRCTSQFRIPGAAAPAPRRPVKNRRTSSASCLPMALALRTRTPPADRSRIASPPIGFTRCSGRVRID